MGTWTLHTSSNSNTGLDCERVSNTSTYNNPSELSYDMSEHPRILLKGQLPVLLFESAKQVRPPASNAPASSDDNLESDHETSPLTDFTSSFDNDSVASQRHEDKVLQPPATLSFVEESALGANNAKIIQSGTSQDYHQLARQESASQCIANKIESGDNELFCSDSDVSEDEYLDFGMSDSFLQAGQQFGEQDQHPHNIKADSDIELGPYVSVSDDF